MATTLPLDDAARRFGIHPATLRRRLKRGELRGVRESTGQGFRWLIEVPDDVAQAAPTQEAPDAQALLKLTLERDALAQEVRRLSAHTSDLQTQLESRTREAGELHRLLAQAHQLALPAPREVLHGPAEASAANGQAAEASETRSAPPAGDPAGRSWWQRLGTWLTGAPAQPAGG